MGRKVSYPYFKAFNQLLGNLDILGQVVQAAVDKNGGSKVTQSEKAAALLSLSPFTCIFLSLPLSSLPPLHPSPSLPSLFLLPPSPSPPSHITFFLLLL